MKEQQQAIQENGIRSKNDKNENFLQKHLTRNSMKRVLSTHLFTMHKFPTS